MTENVQSGDPLIGRELGGYEIRRWLGRGGMATVYIAYQTSVQREVAIKIIRRDLVDVDPNFYSRFEREARTMAALQHAHILPVVDFGKSDGLTYLVMQLMHSSLSDYINRNHPVAIKEVSRLLSQIAEGLDYAHEHRVIHRDLKPENVLLDDQNNCYLADFGIVRLLDNSTTFTIEGHVLGTVNYMAPEVIQGAPATAVSDVYSLGVILYRMLCGRLPFQGERRQSTMHQHVYTLPEPATKYRRELPQACQDVISAALSKGPDNRYSSAGEMAQAFSEAIVMQVTTSPIPLKDAALAVPATVGTVSSITPECDVPPAPVDGRRSLRTLAVLAILLAVAAITIGVVRLNNSQNSEQDAVRYNEVGVSALAVLDYDEALHNFEQAIRLGPTNAAAHFNLGITYEELGDLEAARTAYEDALTYDTQLLLARYRLAELLLDAGDAEEGFQVIDVGVRILHQGQIVLEDEEREWLTFLLLTTRGRAYFMRGGSLNLSLSESDLQQALMLKEVIPYPASAYYYLALVYEAQGEDEAARQAWYDVLATCDANSVHQREWAAQARTAVSSQE